MAHCVFQGKAAVGMMLVGRGAELFERVVLVVESH